MSDTNALLNYNLLTDLYKKRDFTLKNETETTQQELCEVNEADSHERLLKAITWYDKNIRRNDIIISRNSVSKLQYFNPYNVIPCQITTLKAIEAAKIRLKETHMFTIIEGKHETNNLNFKLDLDSIKQDYCYGLEGYNFIGMVELAYFKNAVHEGGELIAPHFQGILWGDLKRKDREKISRKFKKGGRNGATIFKPKKVYDIVGAVSYMFKLPVYGYKLRKKKSKKNYSHTTEYLALRRLYFLYNQLRGTKIDDMLVAGGQGIAIRDNILKNINTQLF